jgi:cephalosporin hydroxylase
VIDDILTRSSYKGMCLQQRQEVLDIFPTLIKNILPKRIIEVGTGHGGLTMFLKDLLSNDGEIYSFDIIETEFHKPLKEGGVILNYKNIFKDEVKDWNCYELKNEWEYLFNITPKIVICDGGHKKGEFNGLAKFLSKGDIIMLHDYSTDKESFNSLNVWNWLECQYSDIKASCEEFNLQPFMHTEFLNVAWGCFQKN